MTKKIWVEACVVACVVVFGIVWFAVGFSAFPEQAPEPIMTTPEQITVNGGQIIPVPDGCVCGEPRDDGKQCDVYIEILADSVLSVWSDVSPEKLEDVLGVTWVSKDGRALGRDPRYGWQTIIDGICALARAEVYGNATCQYTHPNGNIDVDCCANFPDGLELEIIGHSDDCIDEAYDDLLLFIESVYITGPVCQGIDVLDNVYFTCCDAWAIGYEWDVIGYSEFCPDVVSTPPLMGTVCQDVDGLSNLAVFGCCDSFADGLELEIIGHSEFCP